MTYYTAGDYLTPTPTYTLVNGLATIYHKATRDATVAIHSKSDKEANRHN